MTSVPESTPARSRKEPATAMALLVVGVMAGSALEEVVGWPGHMAVHLWAMGMCILIGRNAFLRRAHIVARWERVLATLLVALSVVAVPASLADGLGAAPSLEQIHDPATSIANPALLGILVTLLVATVTGIRRN